MVHIPFIYNLLCNSEAERITRQHIGGQAITAWKHNVCRRSHMLLYKIKLYCYLPSSIVSARKEEEEEEEEEEEQQQQQQQQQHLYPIGVGPI